MIVRVKFEGIATDTTAGNKKHVLHDHIDIHAIDKESAKIIFDKWLLRADGIRGHSNVYHPLGAGGTIKVKSITDKIEKKEKK